MNTTPSKVNEHARHCLYAPRIYTNLSQCTPTHVCHYVLWCCRNTCQYLHILLNVHRKLTECSLNVHGMFTECSLNVHRIFPVWLPNTSMDSNMILMINIICTIYHIKSTAYKSALVVFVSHYLLSFRVFRFRFVWFAFVSPVVLSVHVFCRRPSRVVSLRQRETRQRSHRSHRLPESRTIENAIRFRWVGTAHSQGKEADKGRMRRVVAQYRLEIIFDNI
jgi:hypothetical protein